MQLTTLVAALAADPYQAPEQFGYVLAGWGLCIAGFVAYAVALVVRGRRLARQVPAEERRWMS
jgi:hypothetical protein